MALILCVSVAGSAQKKPLDHTVYDGWKSIGASALSNDGRWLLYTVSPQEGDGTLIVVSARGAGRHEIERGTSARFTDDGKFVVATVVPAKAELDKARKEKKKPEEMPKNSLVILNLSDGSKRTTENVQTWSNPTEFAGWITLRLHPEPKKPEPAKPAEEAKPAEGQPAKKKEHRPGTELLVMNIASGETAKVEFVDQFLFSRDGKTLVYSVSSPDGARDGIYARDLASGAERTLTQGIANYRQLTLHDDGKRLAYYSDIEDYQAKKPAFALYILSVGDKPSLIAKPGSSGLLEGMVPVERVRPRFSEDGRRVFFATAPPAEEAPPAADDAEEKPVFDLWHWKDPLIQPMQLRQVAGERNRTYEAMADLGSKRITALATPELRSVTVADRGNGNLGVGTDDRPYQLESSWNLGANDVYLVDVRTGTRTKVLERVRGGFVLSPTGKYATWWDGEKRKWFAMETANRKVVEIGAKVPHPLHNEQHDTPNDPGSYGQGGWTNGEEWFIVYDRFDAWALDPTGRKDPVNVTNGVGRAISTQFRIRRFDPEERTIPTNKPLFLTATNLETYATGFWTDTFDGTPQRLTMEDCEFGNPSKAKDAEVYVLTRQTFEQFPDLYTTADFKSFERKSDANPQQADYLWGKAELVSYTSMDGVPLKGVVIKPGGYDPAKSYPMIVYFYERLSDTLHQYRAPSPGSSSINPSFYASRGYVVFLPDIPYREGYPGESCYSALIPGVQAVVNQGYVDPKRIGIQGHSWGGYQALYLVTKTNMFAAAEGGAPVSNMISAYGGIRYGTGMSRMFQYENTQSRIGGSLWEYPLRFIENSPIFFADKVKTPLLMLHNDQDGAVPWTEGIQMFVALRRLGKPAWLVNYNGEDHGIGKRANRKDWTIRLAQYFDHYLKGEPMPVWMSEGIPAVQKGRTLGLDPAKGG